MPKSYMPVADVSHLSPDGYSRFFVLVDVLSQIYGKSDTPIQILDVGGGSEFLEQQLKRTGLNYSLTVLDIIEKPADLDVKYIQADATNMDLADRSYDVVVSTDVLEHIPSDKKQAFVDECFRVAKELCIIAAPFDTEGVHEAEIAVNEFNKELFGSGQDWLEEHLEYGKPSIDLLKKSSERYDVPYINFGTQNLHAWMLNTHINLIDAKLGLSKEDHEKINLFYNENILEMNDFVGPTYRHFFVIFKDATKQEAFDARRYSATNLDYDKIFTHTSSLIKLLTKKITELTLLTKDHFDIKANLATLSERVDVLQHENLALKEITARQEQTLKTFAPIISTLRRAPFQKAYAFIIRHKQRINIL